MYPDSLYSGQQLQYNLTNLLFLGSLFILIVAALYLMWNWCCVTDKNKDGDKSTSRRMFMKPVYAHEIEPGIVVLQSESGDYFKILKEYDMKSGNLYGSLSCTRPEMTQPTDHMIHDGDQAAFENENRMQTHLTEERRTLLGNRHETSGFNSVELSGY